MKRIIDVDENLICEGFVRNFTEEEKDVLINAIRYSIPYEEQPQGDLISRDALKKSFIQWSCSGCAFRTSENPTEICCEDCYAKGIEKEVIDNAQTVEERPQGEWIKVRENRMSIDMSGEIVTVYKCSKCGRFITILPSKLADYPFCHCGAEMRGSENEA